MNVGSFLKQSINEYFNNTNIILNSNTQKEETIPNINENEPLPIELGLLNINNNTSYLNSVLQLFKNFNNFSKYYLNNKNSIFINIKKIAFKNFHFLMLLIDYLLIFIHQMVKKKRYIILLHF